MRRGSLLRRLLDESGAIKIPASGTGTATPDVATDKIGADHHQLVGVEFGGTGTKTQVESTSPLPVGDAKASSAAITATNKTTSTGAAALLALNASRLGGFVFNDVASGVLCLKLGANATTSDHTVQLQPGAFYELPRPVFTGALSGTWASTSTAGAAYATEVTA